MSDRELAAILAPPDHDDDEPSVDPADGQRLRREPLAATDADEDEAEADDPLSPEDLVAEMVRQDRLESGEDEDEDAEEDDDEAEDDEDALREKARLYDEWQTQQAQDEANREINAAKAEIDRAYYTLHQQYQEAQRNANAHYLEQKQKVVDRIVSDSHNSPDPEAYRRLHLRNALANAEQAHATWMGNLAQTYDQGVTQLRGRVEQIQAYANRPIVAKQLIAKYGLPDHPNVVAQILSVRDPRDMDERADWLRRTHLQFLEMGRLASQGMREERAKAVKLTQPHPNATSSRPARRKPVQYTGAASELRAIEALR